MKAGIINGPNLNLLGRREPHIYGDLSFEEYLNSLKKEFSEIQLFYRQENTEGGMVEAIQTMGDQCEVLIINAAAFSHTSLAVADAAGALNVPYIEVHISNIFKREGFRHHSYLSAKAAGIMAGFGMNGYRLALLAARLL